MQQMASSFFLSEKIRLGISCELSSREIHMKCPTLFSPNKKKEFVCYCFAWYMKKKALQMGISTLSFKAGTIVFPQEIKKADPDPGVGKRGTRSPPQPPHPEATATHTLPLYFTLLCISYPDTCDFQKNREFINDNERAINKWHAVICQ